MPGYLPSVPGYLSSGDTRVSAFVPGYLSSGSARVPTLGTRVPIIWGYPGVYPRTTDTTRFRICVLQRIYSSCPTTHTLAIPLHTPDRQMTICSIYLLYVYDLRRSLPAVLMRVLRDLSHTSWIKIQQRKHVGLDHADCNGSHYYYYYYYYYGEP